MRRALGSIVWLVLGAAILFYVHDSFDLTILPFRVKEPIDAVFGVIGQFIEYLMSDTRTLSGSAR